MPIGIYLAYMGYQRPRGQNRKPIEQKIAENILGMAAVAAFVLVSPIVGASVMLAAGTTDRLFKKSPNFNREIKRLEKRGFIALTKTEDGWVIKILKRGRAKYKQIEISNLKLPEAGSWDGKWRLYTFDIPEKYRSARNLMRKKMKELGLFNIQRSVLAYPYDCRKELQMIADYYRLGKYATFIETHSIDIDKELRKDFRL